MNWELQLDREVFSNPVIDMDGNIVFTGVSDLMGREKLYSVSNSGVINWEVELEGVLHSAPLITSDSLIYVVHNIGRKGYLVQLDIRGNVLWKYEFNHARARSTRSPNISKDGSTIYLCGSDSALNAINRDGTLQWKYSIAPAASWGEPSISPDGNTIYFVGNNFVLYSVHKDGNLNWSVQLDNTRSHIISPVIDNQGNIYLYAGTTFYSINPDGIIRWQYGDMTGGTYLNGCTIGHDGTIYVTNIWSYYAFDYAGNLKWDMWLQDKYVDIFNIPIVDILGNTYLGTVFTGPNDEEWYNVNFVSFDSEGSIRYKIYLGSGLSLDIDSPGCIDGSGNFYVGSDGELTPMLFSIY